MKKKDLKNLVKKGIAEDITDLSYEQFFKLKKDEEGFNIQLTFGALGRNGALLQGYKTKKQYCIIDRNSLLFCI